MTAFLSLCTTKEKRRKHGPVHFRSHLGCSAIVCCFPFSSFCSPQNLPGLKPSRTYVNVQREFGFCSGNHSQQFNALSLWFIVYIGFFTVHLRATGSTTRMEVNVCFTRCFTLLSQSFALTSSTRELARPPSRDPTSLMLTKPRSGSVNSPTPKYDSFRASFSSFSSNFSLERCGTRFSPVPLKVASFESVLFFLSISTFLTAFSIAVSHFVLIPYLTKGHKLSQLWMLRFDYTVIICEHLRRLIQFWVTCTFCWSSCLAFELYKQVCLFVLSSDELMSLEESLR